LTEFFFLPGRQSGKAHRARPLQARRVPVGRGVGSPEAAADSVETETGDGPDAMSGLLSRKSDSRTSRPALHGGPARDCRERHLRRTEL
jgi:hypothetical protein